MISIIIPTYNEDNWSNHSFSNNLAGKILEIIVSDGGSG
jgi:glycosyltransferase involved in cell wall biosynthesis